MNGFLLFLAGAICAGGGGEIFVRGTVGLARWLRVPPGIIGVTVAAFATSSPELSVAVSSALAGTPQIALGDSLGSNVVNVALILGLALSFSAIRSPRDSIRRDFPVALLVPALTAVLALDGAISRLDAVLLLAIFFAWLALAVTEARRQRSAVAAVIGEPSAGRAIAESVAGLVLLVLAGRLIVAGAGNIAQALGIDAFIVGALIVAIGTSVPELATTVIATLRGHHEIGLGTILGSNIFNGLFIVGVAGSITPITLIWLEIAITLALGAVAVALTYPAHDGLIDRRRGFFLLALYLVYIVALTQA
jgi:cation:H+ antiporter